ncbi:MAG: hypothetical protein FWD52_04985 [Candidatus Bathyarchaeota archaeon]|nr:hypothetical protein [Candidatus Termiticorpusculum sp.]
MNINTKSTFRVSRRKLPLITLLVAGVLIVSLFVYIFTVENNRFFLKDDSVYVELEVYVTTETELVKTINNARGAIVINLDNDIQLTASLNITAKKEITLTSNRTTGFYKLIGANHASTLIVENNGVLRLAGIVVTHAPDVKGRGVTVNPGGTLFMNDGEISGNTESANGGGVHNMGNFTMSGGKISSNVAFYYTAFIRGWGQSSNGYGGGVYNGGVFVLSGGEISGNTAGGRGSGVYNVGTFEMCGGVISSNNSYVDGGVYNAPDSTFDKDGGVIISDITVVGVMIGGSIIMGVVTFLLLVFKKKMRRRVNVV